MSLLTALTARQIDGTTTAAYDSQTNNAKFVVGIVTSDGGGAQPSVSDNQGNTYTYRTITSAAFPPYHRSRIFFLRNPTQGASHTWTVTGNNCSMVVGLFDDDMDASPYDVEALATAGAVTSLQGGSVTPSQADSIIFSVIGFSQNLTPTVGSSFTKAAQANYASGVNYGSALAYKIVASTAAEDPAWSFATAEGVCVINAVFKKAAAAATSLVQRNPMLKYQHLLVR